MCGKVVLVGAGPGDPGLLTWKGKKALEQADVVVYDRLVSPAVLDLIPPGVRRINVGKEAACHPVPQERINEILLEQARAGHRVVRLKGGDPFVFGRGGEELELLARSGVDFEEIPGVTSAIAAPAYAGIPVTHRDYASSLHIITGHARAGKELEIDFPALVRAGGTLVFAMGVSALPRITAGLMEAGMDGATPAALVENGTLPVQRRCVATLATLTQRSAEMEIRSPAVIVVGEVCTLSDAFCWVEKQPLHGRRILVTRPRDRAGALSEKLRDLGAEVWEYPCIETVPLVPCPDMETALGNLKAYEWLVFTSPAGVEVFGNQMRTLGWDGRNLAGIRLAALGPGTARALSILGLRTDFMPAVYDAAHLGQELPARGRVLILRAAQGSPALTETLARRTIAYDDIAVYRTVLTGPDTVLAQAVEEGAVSAVTFTSASTVRGFLRAVGTRADLSRITALCIGQQTAAEARSHGLRAEVAREATPEALVELARVCCQNI